MRLFGKKEKLPPEQEILQKQIELAKQQISELQRLRKQGTQEETRKRLGWVLKNIMPKGIRHPDETVSNIHLYVPGRKGKTKLR